MKKRIIFILILFILIAGGWLIFSRNYPVVMIGWEIITMKNFNENFSASLNYYEQAQRVYGGDSQLLQSEEIKNEIKSALLTSLIEDVLIDKELKKDIKSADLEKLVNNKISDINQEKNAEEAAKILYGFSYDIFKKKILEPMAKKEIFEGRLYLNNKNIDEYLKEIKEKTKVIVLLPEFDWNGKEVIINKLRD
ncbi:MAG: hypothetical protein AAB405_00785 [Patescibacteria group bacterium]